MKKIILAFVLLLLPSVAFGQCNGIFGAQQACGTVAGGIPGPIPFNVFGGPGGLTGNVQTNNGAGGFAGITNAQLATLIGANAGTTNPQGRLSLTSQVCITTTDVAGAATLVYTPCPGNYIPITTNGTTFTMLPFQEYAQNATDTIKSPAAAVANSVYDIWGWLDSATVTVTIASPAVISWTANGFIASNPFSCSVSAGGALPTGFTAGQFYYVISAGLGANSFEFSSTVGGSAVVTTGTQSGTITCTTIRATRGPAWASDTNPGTGAGTSQRSLPPGWITNVVSITNGPGAGLGTLLGSVRTNASAQYMDTAAFRWVSNPGWACVSRKLAVYEPAVSWVYTSGTAFRQANGNTADQLDILQTNSGNQLNAHVSAEFSNTSAANVSAVGIDIDSVTATGISLNTNGFSYVGGANYLEAAYADFNDYIGQGRHLAIWKEIGATGNTFYGTAGGTILQTGITGSICN